MNVFGDTLSLTSNATTLSAVTTGLAAALGSSGVSTTYASLLITALGSSFSIDQAISQSDRLSIFTPGDLTQTTAGSITASRLNVSSAADVNVTLLNTANSVATLQAISIGAGRFSFYDSRDLTIGAAITANGGLLIQTSGALTLANKVSSSASGDAVVLAAGTSFTNTFGSTAISTPNGRWLVYSASPSGDSFGGLDSGNTAVWNSTYASNAPSTIASGNRYVFAYQPTLTFTSTNATKYYGAGADLSSSFTVTASVAANATRV